MPNRFYVQPMGDITQGLSGITQTLQQIGEQKKKEAEKAKIEELKRQAAEIYKTGDPDQMAEFSIQHPEFQKVLADAAGHKNAATEANYRESLFRVMQNPTPENVQAIAQQRQEFLRGQGVSPENSQHTDTFVERFSQDPEGTTKSVEAELAFRWPDRWSEYKKATMAGQPEVKLTADQKNYNLAKSEGFDGSFIDYKRALNADPNADLETLKLRTQILDIQQRMQSKEDDKAMTKQLADKKTKNLVSGIDNVIGTIGKAVSQVQKSPSSTGITGAITAPIPGSPSYNLRRTVQTIQANIGFDKLQSMRDASPTGGALGQVSERELNFLQSTIANLDPNMGEKELVESLNKVKEHYQNWKNTLLGQMPDEELMKAAFGGQ